MSNQLPFDVGDSIIHVKDPFGERHEVMDIVKGMVDGDRFVIRSERTGEAMTLHISRQGLAGWQKA